MSEIRYSGGLGQRLGHAPRFHRQPGGVLLRLVLLQRAPVLVHRIRPAQNARGPVIGSAPGKRRQAPQKMWAEIPLKIRR